MTGWKVWILFSQDYLSGLLLSSYAPAVAPELSSVLLSAVCESVTTVPLDSQAVAVAVAVAHLFVPVPVPAPVPSAAVAAVAVQVPEGEASTGLPIDIMACSNST